MNKQPIEKARDADLRLSSKALRRAAWRANELARKTGTNIVVSRDGVVEYLKPEAADAGPGVQEPSPPHEDQE